MLRTIPLVATTASIAAALLVATLTGCATASPTHGSSSHVNNGSGGTGTIAHSPSTPTGSAAHTATPTPTPSPLPANVLFRITATATDLKSHAVVDLVETVYVPAALTSAQKALLVKICGNDGYPANFPQAVGLPATATATLRAGSPAWTQYSPLGIGMVLASEEAWTGQYAPSPELVGCGPQPPIVIPSSATGIAAVSPASNPAGGPGGVGWYNGVYGWYVTDDIDNQDTPFPTDLISMGNCNLQVGAAALAAAPKVALWPAEPNPKDNNEACEYAPLD
ncbi:MAG: hypothetical protein QOH69_2613 [Actinomycetota bacterium]|jgi:hypothetical protein|nr:hypothetical protein [Actinomycetota bacterium]